MLSIRSILPLAMVLMLGLLAIILQLTREPPPAPAIDQSPPPAQTPPGPSPALSILGDMPDWSRLAAYQETISRADFERLLTEVFTVGEAWRNYIEINESSACIDDGLGGRFILRFAKTGAEPLASRRWRSGAELPPAPSGRPLDGLHIAIDPGHIGGEWAKLEERWLLVGDGPPVLEGDMTLLVARLLVPRLEVLGARVSLVRDNAEPITHLRPDSLMAVAVDTADAPESPEALRKLAERLFYRTAEIRARALVVNEQLKPDLVLCLHFNADAWGDPLKPTLVERTHFHILLNGAYTDDEVRLSDQRFAMLEKLLGRTHDEEAAVGATVADTFAQMTSLPPFVYPEGSLNARPVRGHPYLWARNLLANRLYDCPVLFMEPYVMNSTVDLPRLQAGDYEGLREINGVPQPSIFREYADALTEGLARHYAALRGTAE